MKPDLLYEILQKQLSHETLAEQSHEKIVQSVAAEYVDSLIDFGHIPFQMIRVVIEDIEQEVLEMYRKKTYGHLNLKSYQEAKNKKK